MASDVFVVLDSVQFPNGRSWVTRNRIKTPNGQLWLTVPVKRKGRGLQKIKDIEIDNVYPFTHISATLKSRATGWRRKHFLSLVHFYKRAPYFSEYIDFFNDIYNKNWTNEVAPLALVELNMVFIKQIAQWLGIKTKIIYSSELAIREKKSKLILELCKKLNADTYLSGYGGRKYIEESEFLTNNIKVKYFHFEPKHYPQLWGNFIANLSIIDLLFNCGKNGVDAQIKACCKTRRG